MSGFHSQLLSERLRIAEPAMLLLPVALSAGLLAIEPEIWADLLRYASFYFLVLLPAGIVLSRSLLGGLPLTIFEQAILGYPATVALGAVLFYITDIFNVRWLLFPLALLPAILLLFGTKTRYCTAENNSTAGLVGIFYLLAAVLFFSAFTLTTHSPSTEQPGLYYQDSLWTIGNTWAIIRAGFPVTDARFDGIPFAYHMIQNIHLAFVHEITGIDPVQLHLRITPLYDLFFLIGITVVGAKTFLDGKSWVPALLAFSLLFTAGALDWLVTGYIGHIYINPLSLFFGLHAFILILLLVAHHSLMNRAYVIYTALVALLVFSSKASLVFTLLPSFMIYLLWRRRHGYQFAKRDLLLAAVLFLVVITLKLSLYNGAEGGIIAKSFAPLSISQIEKLTGWVGDTAAAVLAPYGTLLKRLWDFAHILASMLMTLYAGLFFVVWFLVRDVRAAAADLSSFAIFVLGFTIISALWITFFEFPGGELYFIWYAVIAWIFPFVLSVRLLFNARPVLLNRGMAICVLSLGVSLFYMYSLGFYARPWWQASVAGQAVWDQRATISRGEWDAMHWVRGMLPDDVLLISDRRGFFHESSGEYLGRFFGYSALSGKQFFNEGDNFNRLAVSAVAGDRWQLVEQLLQTDSAAEANVIWKKLPATHVIISKRFNILRSGLAKTTLTVFENSDVIILQRAEAAPASSSVVQS